MVDEQINLIIVDDHSGVRRGIINLLEAARDIVVVGEAANGEQAIQVAKEKNPHLILLDVELPDMRGDIVLQQIHKLLPKVKFLAISAHNDRQYILAMMRLGASGYLTKEVIPAKLVEAIRDIIYDNRTWIGPRFVNEHSIFEATLTPKEVRLLKLLLKGQSAYEIASILKMDEKLVGKYLDLLMKKYRVRTLSELEDIARGIFPDSA
jgi:DNA-binding NarL/FixJ family response regulator